MKRKKGEVNWIEAEGKRRKVWIIWFTWNKMQYFPSLPKTYFLTLSSSHKNVYNNLKGLRKHVGMEDQQYLLQNDFLSKKLSSYSCEMRKGEQCIPFSNMCSEEVFIAQTKQQTVLYFLILENDFKSCFLF